MSYILEALKKAQAERQLGSAPDIHAPAPVHAAQPAAASRKPLLLGLSAGIVIAGMAAEGTTLVDRIYHLDRGYDRMEVKLSAVGADIVRIKE